VSDACDFPKDAREGRATVARCRAYPGMAGPPAEAEARSSRGSLASSSADLDGEQRSASGGLSASHYPSVGSVAGADERVSIGSGGGGAAAGPWEGSGPAPGGGGWDGPAAVDTEWLAREAPGLVLACRAVAGGGDASGGLSASHYPSVGSVAGADERVSIGSGGGGAAAGPWEGSGPAPGGGGWDGPAAVDTEWLAREAPGLVLACRAVAGGGDGSGGEGTAGALARAGLAAGRGGAEVPRLLVLDPRTLADVLDAILEVGEAAGAPGEAARLVERMRGRLRAVAAAAARAPRRPRCVTLTALGGRPAAGGAWLAELEELAGAAPERPEGGGGGGGGAAALSWDAVREYAPEVLVLAPEGPPGAALAGVGALAGLPGWWALPAVKAGRVFLTDGAPLTRPGPRLAEGAEALARMLAPEQAAWRCPDKAVLKLALHGGQRCRQRLLANYFQPYA